MIAGSDGCLGVDIRMRSLRGGAGGRCEQRLRKQRTTAELSLGLTPFQRGRTGEFPYMVESVSMEQTSSLI